MGYVLTVIEWLCPVAWHVRWWERLTLELITLKCSPVVILGSSGGLFLQKKVGKCLPKRLNIAFGPAFSVHILVRCTM